MQKIWFPVFLEETVEKFFKEEPKAEDVFLPEEIAAKTGKYEIVPARLSLPAVSQLVFDIPSPDDVFVNDEDELALIRHFHINTESIQNYPVLPKKMDTEEKLRNVFLKNVRTAYKNEIKKCVENAVQEQKGELRMNITDGIFSDGEPIIERARNGKLNGFMTVLIDGVSMVKRGIYSSSAQIYHPFTYDYKEHARYEYNKRWYPFIIWAGPKAKRPGVIIEVRPRTSDDYAALYGCKKEKLPELLRFYEKFQKYVDMPEFMDINICMTKRTYKENSNFSAEWS